MILFVSFAIKVVTESWRYKLRDFLSLFIAAQLPTILLPSVRRLFAKGFPEMGIGLWGGDSIDILGDRPDNRPKQRPNYRPESPQALVVH